MKPEKPAQVQKHENDQRHLFLCKMRVKYKLKVLKSDINVALLCILHSTEEIASKAHHNSKKKDAKTERNGEKEIT